MDAVIHVYTFRAGVLSKLGHDLQFTLRKFHISARGRDVVARLQPASLTVDGVIKNGRLDAGALSDGDKQKIRQAMLHEVLRVRDVTEARFTAHVTSTQSPFFLHGQLTLGSATHPLEVVLDERAGRLRGSVELCPSQWGVTPYRALGGALKVQDRVVVTLDAIAAWHGAFAELDPTVELVWTGEG